jgi:Tfp pilus assembly protein PilO
MDPRIRTLDRLCIVAIVVVSVGLGYVLLSRAIKEHRQIRQENELLSKRTQDLAKAENNVQRLNVLLESTQTELRILNESIPDSAKMGEFLKQLDSLMSERRVELVSVQPLPTEEERLYTSIPLQLAFKGSFLNIYGLLHDFETMNRTMVMKKMSIQRKGNDPECRVDLTASVFER